MKNLKSIRENLQGVCWKGYEAIGTKQKNGKTVPNCVPKNEAIIKESPGSAGHDSLRADAASVEALRAPSKQSHMNAAQLHSTAAARFSGRAQAYHQDKVKLHTAAAAAFKESALDSPASLSSTPRQIGAGVNEVSGAGEFGIPVTPGATMNIEDTDHAKQMVVHHDEAQKALKAGDLDAYHAHLDKKYEHAVELEKQNAGKPVKTYEGSVNEASSPDSLSRYANKKSVAAKDSAGHQAASDAHYRAIQAHRKASYKLKTDTPEYKAHFDQIAHHSNKLVHHSQVLGEAKTADSYSTAAHDMTQDARRGQSALLHSKAATAHKDASEAHSRKIDSLIRSKASPETVSHHEAQVKKHDQQAQVHNFYSHRLGVKKEEVDEAAGADEHLNSRIVKQTQAAVAAAKKGDKYAQQYHLAKVASLKRQERGLDEEVQSNSEVELNALDDKDRTELNRLTILVRLGLMEQKDLLLLRRSLKKIKAGRQVTNLAEKRILFQLLENLVDVVIGDPSMFNKLRVAVARDRKN